MVSESLNIAVFGAGRIGKRHARTIAVDTPGAQLFAICDIDEFAARSVAQSNNCSHWTVNPADIFSSSDVDGVIIATSTDAHADLIVNAAQSGKHTFCEKPIALDLQATDRALAAVSHAGTILQIGFQRRFDRGFVKAWKMIADGTLGQIESIRDTMRDPEPPPREYVAKSGGLFRDMTIHNFDCVRWLMDDEPVEVFAAGANLVDPMFGEFGDIDTSVVTISFARGGLAVIDNSRRSGYGYDLRTEVFGSEGAVFVGRSDDLPVRHLSANGVCTDHIFWFLERFDEAFIAEIQDFVSVIRENGSPRVTGLDGRAAMALAYAAEASLREHQPVSVSRFAAKD
jgi:myo-inositol 2-dehydrogenase / D-chiro-inositol 1-dehydrogenase